VLKGKEVENMQMRAETLRETLGLLKPVVPRKPMVPVLKNVLLSNGKAVATDMETMVILDLPEADGECLVPHREALELLRYVPGDELVAIEARGNSLELTWGSGSASYDAAQVKDYPPVPELKAAAEASLDGDSLVAALSSMVGYCATGDDRPVLAGVALFPGERIEVAAGDGFRMAYQQLPMTFPAEDKVVVPRGTIRALAHLWENIPPPPPVAGSLIEQITARRELQLALGDGRLKIAFGQATIIAQLIKGTPPNFAQLIPEEVSQEVRFFAPDLERAVRRLKDVARDGSGIVRLTWTEASLTAVAKSDEKGEGRAEVPAQAEGGPGRIALNVSYLLDYLKGREGVVTMGVRGAQDPVILSHGSSPLVLIMPMLVQW